MLGNILPIITLPIMTRFLLPEDFGIVALAAGFPTILVSFLSCNVHTGAERYFFEYHRDNKALSRLINTTITFLVLSFGAALPVVFLLKNWFSLLILGSVDYGFALFLSYVSACLGILSTFYMTLYRNMEKAGKFSFYMNMMMIINTGLGLLLVVGFRFGYISLIYAPLGAGLIVFSLLFISFQRDFPFSFDRKMLIDNLKYGIPLLPNLLTSAIYGLFDKYMLRSFVSLSSTGIYSLAQNITTKLFVFMTAVQSTFHPIFMKDIFDRGKAAASSVGRNFTIFTYISLTAVLGMILFGEELIYLLAPSSYSGAINVALILLCGIATQTFGKIIGLPLAYAKKAYLSFPVSILGVILNVLLNILLIPRWGAIGAGLTTTFTIVMMNYISHLIAQKYFRINYEVKILLFLYLNVFLSAFLLVYLRMTDAHFILKYSVKLASLLAFIMTGIHAKIITRNTINIVLGLLRLNNKIPVKNEAVTK